ncbi:hypothetical protein D9611_006815 [Ephemerocybe angulata]|uniref:Protein CPL1-like domain-containing protein n=1 Tax=Ephemerocybe angulata TaxID=980116 RepID=A0A8H5B025_9AGAR|nr:hypothetical protein D9611_006815 [Tulosesus angulatus]
MKFSLAAVAVFALAQIAGTIATPTTTQSCKKDEFWYGAKSCCAPSKPPVKPTPPPTGVGCPKSWSYNEPKKCCLPHTPTPPAPQCPSGYTWWEILHKCLPTPQPPTPHPPQPSKGPNNPHGPYHKRVESRISLCPAGLRACPLLGLLAGDYECLDVATELTSCGGCASEGKGQDCTAIQGAWNVGCERSACVVHSCSGGYELSADKKSCVPL